MLIVIVIFFQFNCILFCFLLFVKYIYLIILNFLMYFISQNGTKADYDFFCSISLQHDYFKKYNFVHIFCSYIQLIIFFLFSMKSQSSYTLDYTVSQLSVYNVVFVDQEMKNQKFILKSIYFEIILKQCYLIFL